MLVPAVCHSYMMLVCLMPAATTRERSFQLCWKVKRKVWTASWSAADRPTQTCAKSNSLGSERTAGHSDITEEKVCNLSVFCALCCCVEYLL